MCHYVEEGRIPRLSLGILHPESNEGKLQECVELFFLDEYLNTLKMLYAAIVCLQRILIDYIGG